MTELRLTVKELLDDPCKAVSLIGSRTTVETMNLKGDVTSRVTGNLRCMDPVKGAVVLEADSSESHLIFGQFIKSIVFHEHQVS